MKKKELSFVLAVAIIMLCLIVFCSGCTTIKVSPKTQYPIKDTTITHQRMDNSSGIDEVLPSRKN